MSSTSTWWSHLSIYARAGLVIGCLLAFLFLFSTAVLCFVRRGRLISTTRRRRGQSLPKQAYRSPPAPDKEFMHSNAVEVRDGDEGEGEGGDAGQRFSGFGAGTEVMPPSAAGEEVALQEYDGRGHGYEYGYGYAHAYGDGNVDGDGERGHADGYARDESREREQRTWNAV